MTVDTTVRRMFDGARAVEFINDPGMDVFAVWKGGTQFTVGQVHPERGVVEQTIFTVSDEYGEPVDYDTAVEHMNDWLQTEFPTA